MSTSSDFEIFLATAPGLEATLRAEAVAAGWPAARATAGGVTIRGGWPDVWRANLALRCTNRVLARFATFRVMHIAQLDKRARKLDWRSVLAPDVSVRVEVTCHKSRIYHSGAATQRIERAIKEELGAPISAEAELCVMARIANDICTISIDTSGDLLHRRGFKQAVNKAPMRETMAAAFLKMCGYQGQEAVVDPMCGSGTFVIEAAEIAANVAPGRGRSFAFERLATFDAAAWNALRDKVQPVPTTVRFYGSDRDAGAVAMSQANAERAGVAGMIDFRQHSVSDLKPPPGSPGLVIVNPPYGTRIGDRTKLQPLYKALGATLSARFAGWRVGLIATDAQLAAATGLPFEPPGPPVSHGGLRVTLYRTAALAPSDDTVT